jgi:uncharacterized protein (DUF2126 family)
VPLQPEGSEWSITALGPTKLRYAYALASALQEEDLPHAVDFYCPGKAYPGELNPRWAIVLVWNRDSSPLVSSLSTRQRAIKPSLSSLRKFRTNLLKRLGFKSGWLTAIDPFQRRRGVWVLPLDYETARSSPRTGTWATPSICSVLKGPAGLRLPLGALPADARRRALTVEVRDGEVHLFFPPLLQEAFWRSSRRVASL